MKTGPFFLALFLASFLTNVVLFLVHLEWEQENYPPGEQGSYQADANKEVPQNVPSAQINCDPNCSAETTNKNRNQSAVARFISKTINDPLIAFTGIMSLATFVLAIYIGVVANSTKAAAEHVPRVERAYISGGGGPPPNNPGTLFRFDINNFGKTAGNIIEIRWGFFSANAIPAFVPAFQELHFYYDWIKPDLWRPGIHLVAVPGNIPNPVIFGRFYYRDVFNKSHSSGFILQIHPNGASTPIRAPAAYTEERDEPDPDQNLSYRV